MFDEQGDGACVNDYTENYIYKSGIIYISLYILHLYTDIPIYNITERKSIAVFVL